LNQGIFGKASRTDNKGKVTNKDKVLNKGKGYLIFKKQGDQTQGNR